MTLDPRTPVIVGAGQVLSRDRGEARSEPATLIAEALRSAAADSGAGERLLRRADSVRCVPVLCWHYPDAAALIAEELGASPRETVQSSPVGGDGPQVLINDTAAGIAAGDIDVALLGGGEAVTVVLDAERSGRRPSWRTQAGEIQPTRTLPGDDAAAVTDAEATAGLAPPVRMYALIESAVRADAGDTRDAHLERIAGLWSRFSAVAAANPHAWLGRAYRPSEIATPTADNRAVCTPYTKLLTANIQVNMAAGLILTSVGAAEQLGVPKERWVFIHSGAQARDRWYVSERDALASSPAIRAAGLAALDAAGVGIDDITHLDLYSCFPSAVQIAANELGVALDEPNRPPTVTGGLTFAGGPGNNYATHAVATLVGLLREDPDAYGLATALGWYLTKHAVGVYSAREPRRPYATQPVQPALPPARRQANGYTGAAHIEAYTVPYDRGGKAEAAIISALTPDGARALVRSDDPAVLAAILAEDPIGMTIELAGGTVASLSAA
jgi:acetyl-CoA C-acetyltransferase